MSTGPSPGPDEPTALLAGLTVVELGGAGPVPFAATALADLGARVIRIDRPGSAVSLYPRDPRQDVLGRGRESIVLDLKQAGGVEIALQLIERADAFVEGLRPGVVERLGLGPVDCLTRNPRLVYGRISGYGRTGPLAQRPGHDINFIAIGGALAHTVGRDTVPAIPLSLIGDYGGGGMSLALGVVSGMLTAARSGRGCVVDTSILDAVTALMSPLWGIRADGEFDDALPGSNVAEGAAPFHAVYACADGRYLAVGAIETAFRTRLAELLGTRAVLGESRDTWKRDRAELDALFATRTQAEWWQLLGEEDVCVSPVLSLGESAEHVQLTSRDRFRTSAGVLQPRPPWTVNDQSLPLPGVPPTRGQESLTLLDELGVNPARRSQLLASGAVRTTE